MTTPSDAIDLSRSPYGHLPDEEIATMARMLMRSDLNHEAVCVAARDRIMNLRQQLATERAARERAEGELAKLNLPFEDADERIHIFKPDGRDFYCCRYKGGEAGPFKTWREAYRFAEMSTEWRDVQIKLAIAEKRVWVAVGIIHDLWQKRDEVNDRLAAAEARLAKVGALVAKWRAIAETEPMLIGSVTESFAAEVESALKGE